MLHELSDSLPPISILDCNLARAPSPQQAEGAKSVEKYLFITAPSITMLLKVIDL
jgi:hypothetical protein